MRFPERPRAVITGAASGLGRALALELATAQRARLVISDLDADGLARTRDDAESAGAEVHAHPGDVADLEQVAALRTLALDRFGGTDILVNNAGVAVAGPVGEVAIEDWRWQIEVNLFGVLHGCHLFTPDMRSAGRGWILNVASAAGLISVPEMGPYNVTKSAVVALTRTMRSELAGSGVVASALCPSFFQSRIHTRARTTRPELVRVTERLITESRWTAEAIARVALRGLEGGRLHVVPQLDARLFWRLQRLFPSGFQWLIGALHRSGRLERWVSSPKRTSSPQA